jgi:hypothetical protein
MGILSIPDFDTAAISANFFCHQFENQDRPLPFFDYICHLSAVNCQSMRSERRLIPGLLVPEGA